MLNRPLIINSSDYLPNHRWHPSVVYLDKPVSGYRWWMAETPFPPHYIEPYQDRYELPCIHYSKDGITWLSIPTNPIDDINDTDLITHNYLSDPHLIYVKDHFECYYRKTFKFDKDRRENTTQLLKKTSVDGFNWSNCTVIADLRKDEDRSIWGEQIISPSVYFDGNIYHCWYVDASGYVSDRHILYTTSIDGITWKKAKLCTLLGAKEIPWHIDVQCYMWKWQLLCYDHNNHNLSHYTSEDGLAFHFDRVLLRPSKNPFSFSSYRIYRSCSVLYNDVVRIYFSEASRVRAYIGLLETEDFVHLKYISGSMNAQYVLDTISMSYFVIKRVVNKFKRIIYGKFDKENS